MYAARKGRNGQWTKSTCLACTAAVTVHPKQLTTTIDAGSAEEAAVLSAMKIVVHTLNLKEPPILVQLAVGAPSATDRCSCGACKTPPDVAIHSTTVSAVKEAVRSQTEGVPNAFPLKHIHLIHNGIAGWNG